MTIAALSDNISEQFVDMVREQVALFKNEVKYVIANIMLSGYNYYDKGFIVDIPESEMFDNIELFVAIETDHRLTSDINGKILRPKPEKMVIVVMSYYSDHVTKILRMIIGHLIFHYLI